MPIRQGPPSGVVPERAGPGEESVWDHPRPPRVEPVPERLRVVFRGVSVAETTDGKRVLETSQAPAYYFPPEDVRMHLVDLSTKRTVCEWKGDARYYDVVVVGQRIRDAAWQYEEPRPGYEAIAEHFAFYPLKASECWVGDERARPMEGGFYGGWITSRVVGPFKGAPGTEDW